MVRHRRHVQTYSAKARVTVTCEHCGTVFFLGVSAHSGDLGRGVSGDYTDARLQLKSAVRNYQEHAEARRCPHCGRYQTWMLGQTPEMQARGGLSGCLSLKLSRGTPPPDPNGPEAVAEYVQRRDKWYAMAGLTYNRHDFATDPRFDTSHEMGLPWEDPDWIEKTAAPAARSPGLVEALLVWVGGERMAQTAPRIAPLVRVVLLLVVLLPSVALVLHYTGDVRNPPSDAIRPRRRGRVARGAGAVGGRPAPRSPKDEPAPEAPPAKFTNTIGMTMVFLPPGQFLMGSPAGERHRGGDEAPRNRVTIAAGFYMSAHEVTQGQYWQVMGQKPSGCGGGEDCPVEKVSWADAAAFCRDLSEVEGKAYRLPTEAEWEYACRAGCGDAFCFGGEGDRLGAYAWYADNADGRTHPVGRKRPNAWGLYDMHGNVWEWCSDWYGPYSAEGREAPPEAGVPGRRVLRGGSWHDAPGACRSANRFCSRPDKVSSRGGFRVVCAAGRGGPHARPASRRAPVAGDQGKATATGR